MSSPPDSIDVGILFLGCPSTTFVRSTVSHERLEEQFWYNWHGTFTSPYWSKGQDHSMPSMWQDIHVNAGESQSMF